MIFNLFNLLLGKKHKQTQEKIISNSKRFFHILSKNKKSRKTSYDIDHQKTRLETIRCFKANTDLGLKEDNYIYHMLEKELNEIHRLKANLCDLKKMFNKEIDICDTKKDCAKLLKKMFSKSFNNIKLELEELLSCHKRSNILFDLDRRVRTLKIIEDAGIVYDVDPKKLKNQHYKNRNIQNLIFIHQKLNEMSFLSKINNSLLMKHANTAEINREIIKFKQDLLKFDYRLQSWKFYFIYSVSRGRPSNGRFTLDAYFKDSESVINHYMGINGVNQDRLLKNINDRIIIRYFKKKGEVSLRSIHEPYYFVSEINKLLNQIKTIENSILDIEGDLKKVIQNDKRLKKDSRKIKQKK